MIAPYHPHQALDTYIPAAGAGACWIRAALAACDCGAKGLVVGRDALPQGSTLMSQDHVCAADSKLQRRKGIGDDGVLFSASGHGVEGSLPAAGLAVGVAPARQDDAVAHHTVLEPA